MCNRSEELKAFKLALDSKVAVCTRVPYRPMKNLTFILNMSDFKYEKDILCDGLGSFKNNSKRTWFYTYDGSTFITSTHTECNYIVTVSYFTHKHSSDFKKRVVKLAKKDGNVCQLALLVYRFDENQHEIVALPHGNSKSGRPFNRTMPSVMSNIRENIGKKSVRSIFNDSFIQAGGALNSTNPSTYSRDTKQIYNVKQSVCGTSRGKDDLDEMTEVLRLQNTPGSFIRNVQKTQYCKLSVTLATDHQLKMMENFCLGKSALILGADMTYNCGRFYVTPLTFKNPLLLHRHTLVQPTMLGPMLIHTDHNTSVYNSFAANLVNNNPKLSDIKFFGSDRQLEIFNGFKCHMPKLQHLICRKHVEDNITRYLTQKHLSNASKAEILNDMFLDLTDCEDEESFDAQVLAVKAKWDMVDKDIYPWFVKYQASTFKCSLIKKQRLAAGLQPNEHFYNNANESINKVLKSTLNRKSSIPDIIREFENICETQRNNFHRAIFDDGLYRVRTEYAHCKIKKEHWFSMTAKSRSAAIARFESAYCNFDNTNLKRKQTLIDIITDGVSKNSGRKPSKGLRKRVKKSQIAEYCTNQVFHQSHVIIRLRTNHPLVRICHSCRETFDDSVTKVAAVKTYRKFKHPHTGVITLTKQPQFVYAHLNCVSHQDFVKKPFHLCNYLDGILKKEELDLVLRCGNFRV